MSDAWQASVVLITSTDRNESHFGTGFVIDKDEQTTCLLTCAHVVRDVGGPDKVEICGSQARVIASSPEDGADLAVLRTEELLDRPPLPLYTASEKGKLFSTAGFQLDGKQFLIRKLHGTLGEQVGVQERGRVDRIRAWDLEVTDKYPLQPGYSGSPVVDEYGNVIGVVNTRRGEGKTGVAISIETLKKVWLEMPPRLFAQSNCRGYLGYTRTENSTTTFSPDPKRTYALVVGIEKYRLGDEVDGPACDGRRFADWLSAQGVPQKNIALLLSPLDRNWTFLDSWSGPYRWAATRERVRYATDQWLRQQPGEQFYLFWEGPGFMSSTRSQRLFYADSTTSDWHHLVLESLLAYLQSASLPGYQKQMCFINAYVNCPDEFSQEPPGMGDTFSSEVPLRTCQQFVLTAAQEGKVTTTLSQGQSELFSKTLFEELASGPSPRWPPDMERLIQRMEKRFVQLREGHATNQQPIKLEMRKWGGDATADVSDNSLFSQRGIARSSNQTKRTTSLGKQLRSWRLKTGKRQRPFARLIGVNDTVIQDWESGEIVPSLTYLKKIIEVHLSLGTLSKGEEREEIEKLWETVRMAGVPVDERWLKDILDLRSTTGNVWEKDASIYTDEIQQCIAGLTASIVDRTIQRGIRAFLELYLGSATHPVPFGGRDENLADLDAWLNEQQPPYFLLTAPAGRGKSALLVRWSQRVVTRRDVVLLFVPVSIRFNTNLASSVFSTIVTRLAALHKKKVPFARNTPLEVWQSLMADYLRRPLADGRQLILILDGIDEAADWEIGPALFPLTPAPGTRIILSARTGVDRENAQAWLRTIGWDRSELVCMRDLNPLTPRGIADVLRRMGISPRHLDTEPSLAKRLHELSKGDPLLVSLYVDDLRAHGNTAARLLPEDLSTIQPGLEGYFDRWWEDQRQLWGESTRWKEPAVKAIFNVLACAFGPMNKDALLRLVPPDINLNTWTLKETLHPLKRLVSGNGQQGYVFSHFRLGIFFYEEQLTEEERRTVEGRLLRWGTETLEALNGGELPPGRVNPYIVQYYGPHLERSGARANAFFALISNGWRKAWEAFEGLYTGFLDDVGRAWKMAEQEDSRALREGQKAPYLGIEVLCALCQASVVSWRSSTPITMLVDGVKSGVVKDAQGLSYAQQLPDHEQRGTVLAELVDYLPKQKQSEVVRELLEMIPQIGNELTQSTLLIMISPHLSGPSLLEALTLAHMLTHQLYRLEAELSLIPRLPESMKNEALQDALKIAQAIHYSAIHYQGHRQYKKVALARALGELARYTADAEPLKETLLRSALTIAPEIENMPGQGPYYEEQAQILIALFPYLSEQQLRDIIIPAQKLRIFQYLVYAHIARYVQEPLRSEVVQQVLQARQKVKQDGLLSKILMALIPAVEEHVFPDVLKLVESIHDETNRLQTFVQLAYYAPKEFQNRIVQTAIQSVRGVENPRERAEALAELSHFTDHEKEAIVQEALVAAKAVKDKVKRAETLVRVAPHVQKEDQIETVQEALKIIQSIQDERYQAYPMAAFVSYAPDTLKDRLAQQAMGLVRTAQVNKLLLQALVDISAYLPGPFQDEALQEILTKIEREHDERDKMYILTRLAPFIPQQYQQEVLPIVHSMKNERNRLLILAKLLHSFSEHQKSELALEVLAAVRTIKDEEIQAQILKCLAPCLSEQLLLEIVQIGRTMLNEKYKTQILIASLPSLPIAEQNQVAQEVLLSLRAIPRHMVDDCFVIHVLRVLAPYHPTPGLIEEAVERAKAINPPNFQANALADLVLHVSEPEKNTIIHLLAIMVRAIGPETLEIVLRALNPVLEQLPSTMVYPLWRKILHGLGEHTRRDLLIGLSILASVIFDLGGENAVIEISERISQVSDWWP